MFDIKIQEVPLTGIRTPEQLAAFVLKSMGLSDLKDDSDVRILLAFIENRGGGLKAEEVQAVTDLGQTATYGRIKKFLKAGLIYKAKGAVYKLRERSLGETLDFRVRKDIDRVFAGIVEVAREIDDMLERKTKQAKKGQ